MKVNVASPRTCLTIGVIVLSPLAWPQTAHASVVESYWIPLTGDYEDPANWSGPVPDETVTAVFDVSFDPQPGPFIFFNADHTSDRVIVRAGQPRPW